MKRMRQAFFMLIPFAMITLLRQSFCFWFKFFHGRFKLHLLLEAQPSDVPFFARRVVGEDDFGQFGLRILDAHGQVPFGLDALDDS